MPLLNILSSPRYLLQAQEVRRPAFIKQPCPMRGRRGWGQYHRVKGQGMGNAQRLPQLHKTSSWVLGAAGGGGTQPGWGPTCPNSHSGGWNGGFTWELSKLTLGLLTGRGENQPTPQALRCWVKDIRLPSLCQYELGLPSKGNKAGSRTLPKGPGAQDPSLVPAVRPLGMWQGPALQGASPVQVLVTLCLPSASSCPSVPQGSP